MVRCHGGCHCSVPLLHAGHCWVPCGKVPLLGAIAGCNRLDVVPLLGAMVRCHCAIAATIAGCKRRGVVMTRFDRLDVVPLLGAMVR